MNNDDKKKVIDYCKTLDSCGDCVLVELKNIIKGFDSDFYCGPWSRSCSGCDMYSRE